MESTACIKERLTLTLKSSLLCAVMLIPAVALADLPETDRVEQSTLDAVRTALSDTAVDPSSPATPAQQRRISRLSGHIQRKYRVSETNADRIVSAAVRSAERHQLAPELILAVIAVESTFKERAVSRAGARGLMQVLPSAHGRKIREIGGTHRLMEADQNIHVGTRILAQYLDLHSGNLRRALLNYNGSLGMRRSSYPEKIMRVYNDLRQATIEG